MFTSTPVSCFLCAFFGKIFSRYQGLSIRTQDFFMFALGKHRCIQVHRAGCFSRFLATFIKLVWMLTVICTLFTSATSAVYHHLQRGENIDTALPFLKVYQANRTPSRFQMSLQEDIVAFAKTHFLSPLQFLSGNQCYDALVCPRSVSFSSSSKLVPRHAFNQL